MIEIIMGNELPGGVYECPKCGEEIELGDNFCSSCDEPIERRE